MTKNNASTAVRTRAAKAATPTVDKDAIVQSSGSRTGEHYIKSVGGKSFTFPTELWVGDVRKLVAIGASFSAAKKAIEAMPAKAKPQLARGIVAKDAQHSAKAVSDAATRGKPKATGKADKVQAKGKATADAKAAAPKSKSTAGIVSTKNGEQKIVVVAKESPYKPGSKADDTFALFAKAGTVDGFKKLVAKNPSKYDAGYIRYAARDGHIKVG